MVTLNIDGNVENVNVPADVALLWALRDVVRAKPSGSGASIRARWSDTLVSRRDEP